MAAEVLIVGTVGIDTIETPSGLRQNILGGSAVHAGMAARFFTRPALISCVGEDFPGEHRVFLDEHVDTRSIERMPQTTFRWHGRYSGDLARAETLKTELGVVASYKPRFQGEKPRVLFLANGDPNHQIRIARDVGDEVITLLDSMDFWILTKRDALIAAMQKASIVILNADEAATLSGEHGVVRSGYALIERMGIVRIIIKKGEHGSCYFGPEGYRAVSAYPARKIVDPTGAGDSFAGALAGTIAMRGELNLSTILEGMYAGTVVSSFIVEDFGCARLAKISSEDIAARTRELQEIMSYDNGNGSAPLIAAVATTQEKIHGCTEVHFSARETAENASNTVSTGVRDPRLAPQGKLQIELAEANMKALMAVRERFASEKPFVGLTIGMALHVTKETAVLVRTLVAGGARVAITGCNPLSTQDDVAAALAQEEGVSVWAHKGESNEDYYRFLNKVIDARPNITIDDGCDLVTEIHTKRHDALSDVIGGCEETTTGIIRLKAMEREGVLKYPVVAVNDNKTKHLMDNFYGTGQSTLDGLIRASNTLIAGKTLVIVGYGSCGKGLANRARGMGANVTVCEVDSFRALQAVMDGFRVMPMMDAARIGDVFITVSGNKHVIRMEHIAIMKDGVILANSGHFDNEIDLVALDARASAKRRVRQNYFDEYMVEGRRVYVAGEGRLVNLACAEGHPSEVMSLSFCGQALACEWLVKQRNRHPELVEGSRILQDQRDSSGFALGMTGGLEPRIYTLPADIDEEISRLQLSAIGVRHDDLTEEQKAYLSGWKEGT